MRERISRLPVCIVSGIHPRYQSRRGITHWQLRNLIVSICGIISERMIVLGGLRMGASDGSGLKLGCRGPNARVA